MNLPRRLENELYYRAYGNHAYDTRKNGYAVKRLNGTIQQNGDVFEMLVSSADYRDYLEYIRVHGGCYFEGHPITHTAKAVSDTQTLITFP